MDDKLETFDDEHGEVVLNALTVYADRMREAAAEAGKGTQPPGPPPVTADLRSWPAEDLLVLARAAGMLWDSTGRKDPLDVLSERQLVLLDQAAASYLMPEPGPVAEAGTQVISVRPTARGFESMAQLFTETADRAGTAYAAYEHLTERDEPGS